MLTLMHKKNSPVLPFPWILMPSNLDPKSPPLFTVELVCSFSAYLLCTPTPWIELPTYPYTLVTHQVMYIYPWFPCAPSKVLYSLLSHSECLSGFLFGLLMSILVCSRPCSLLPDPSWYLWTSTCSWIYDLLPEHQFTTSLLLLVPLLT